mmetsp:Transcript_271/g.677  ORF Transcript_271/g.677 Transcript_271/m.677 type:complete len:750 (-) Transcript_271:70-2319(-)
MDLMPECHNGISLICMPHEVTAGISWCLDVKDIGQVVATCQVLREEVVDPELWLHLFMRSCWPPSDTLLGFAEECSANLASVDWRARLSARAAAVPAIVVDMGRGYTKYTVVHGVRGRTEQDGSPPTLVQLCSSPTHRPDCSRQEQLIYIHQKLDADLWRAAADPENPLHAAAVGGADLKVGAKVLVLDRPNQPFRIVGVRPDDTWEVRPWETGLRRRTLRMMCNSPSTGNGQDTDTFSVISAGLKPVRCADELPLLVGEPFIVTSTRRGEDIGSTEWAHEVRAQLQGRSGPVRLAPQAQISLWAHGIDHGIVVNIGQVQTIALPVVNGELVPGAACASQLGGSSLTMAMLRFLNARLPFVDDDLMTWCRDLKENYCYAAPPTDQTGSRRSLRERLRAGDDFGVQRMMVESPMGGGDMVELAEERVLVPEMFFERGAGFGPTLPDLILTCAGRVQSNGRVDNVDLQRLLQQVVLVGGGADIPGLRPRTEFEMRSLLLDGMYPHLREVVSPEEVFVLNPPLGYSEPLTSPRFAPLVGGCVRAASSWHFDNTKAQRHSTQVEIPEQREFSGRVPGWMDRRRMMLAGPTVFRTGGGGGEDDDFWQYLVEGALEDRQFLDEVMSERSSDDEDTSDDSPTMSPADNDEADASCVHAMETEEAGDSTAEPSQTQASSRTKGAGGKSATKGSNASGASASGAARSVAKGGKGGARFDRVRKGKGKGRGKGKSKGKGKGLQQRRIWRPVSSGSAPSH